MRNALIITIAALLAPPVSGQGLDVSGRVMPVVGLVWGDREVRLPAAPVVGLVATLDAPVVGNRERQTVGLLLGADFTVVAITENEYDPLSAGSEETKLELDIAAAGRLGTVFYLPLRPSVFGFVGGILPRRPPEWDYSGERWLTRRRILHYGVGGSISLGRVTIEARYMVDGRFDVDRRESSVLAIGYGGTAGGSR